jgi:hypothetical protein
MTTTANATIGHLALHYRPGDYERARHLFEALGAHLEDNGPAGFCSIAFDRETWNYVDNVMYLSQAGPVLLGLEDAVLEGLRVGTADEDPRLLAFREQRASFPEALDHVGVRYDSFDALEGAVLALQSATAPGGALEGRAEVTRYRARKGQDPRIDAAMASSPVFGDDDVDGTSLADYGVQVFVKTDVCAAGLFAFGQTFELDYFWDPAFTTLPQFGRR